MTRCPTRWLVVLVCVAVGLAGALWWVGARDVPDAAPAAPESSPFPSSAAGGVRPGPPTEALDVLREWDRRRARAYATADVAGLRELYVDGSAAGTADARILRGYERRGLRVRHLDMQVLALEVLGHRAGRWRIRVTDRLAGAVAVAVGSGRRIELPRDRASTRVLTLRRDSRADRWRMVSVTS